MVWLVKRAKGRRWIRIILFVVFLLGVIAYGFWRLVILRKVSVNDWSLRAIALRLLSIPVFAVPLAIVIVLLDYM